MGVTVVTQGSEKNQQYLERLETFHKEETLQMTLAGKCFTGTSRNFEVTAT